MRLFLSILALLFTLTASSAASDDFSRWFSDSTLRVDIIAGTTSAGSGVMLRGMSKSQGWAGRRSNLGSTLLAGNGRLTMTDVASGDTIYAGPFSTLFNEWLATDLPSRGAQGFEHTVTAPLPKRPANIEISFNDARHLPVASARWIYDPSDILVRTRPSKSRLESKMLHGRKSESDRRIDVAILAEGYTKGERKLFFADARKAVESLLTHEPFTSMADKFNFVAIHTPSQSSGVSVPASGDWRDDAFGSHFSTFYSDRYLTIPSIFALYDALDGIAAEHIIVLANTAEYGGGGIFNNYTLTAAHHPNFREVLVHEFGHSFGGLADEYFYEGDVMDDTYPTDIEPWEPNVTTLVDFRGKWEELLPEGSDPKADPEATGMLHEGAAYSFKGIWRAAPDCRMKSNDAPDFCPACTLALKRIVEFYTE